MKQRKQGWGSESCKQRSLPYSRGSTERRVDIQVVLGNQSHRKKGRLLLGLNAGHVLVVLLGNQEDVF